MLFAVGKSKKVIDLTKMNNGNIRKYAELAVRGQRGRTVADIAVRVLKVLYCLAAVSAIVTCLIMMVGNLVWMSEYKSGTNSDELALFHENRTQFITMLAALFSLVASFFLMHFKLSIPFALVGCVDCVIIFTTLYGVSVRNDIENGGMTNFWVMAIPSMLCAALAIALGALLFITYRLRIPRMYDKIIYNLYQSHTKNGEIKVSPEEFEKICDSYTGEEIFRTDIPLKKSMRRRKEKQENDN